MVGLFASTNSKLVVLGGIITIAIADACSDALGMHLSEENSGAKEKSIWRSTSSTFITKFFFAIIFVIPVIFLSLQNAIVFSIILGFVLLGIFSYVVAINNKKSKLGTILEHLFIGALVIVITYYVGILVRGFFV